MSKSYSAPMPATAADRRPADGSWLRRLLLWLNQRAEVAPVTASPARRLDPARGSPD